MRESYDMGDFSLCFMVNCMGKYDKIPEDVWLPIFVGVVSMGRVEQKSEALFPGTKDLGFLRQGNAHGLSFPCD